MGSKKKAAIFANTYTNAYGTTMTKTEKANIDRHNSAERAEGQTKDANYTAERQAIAAKSGTVEFKSIVKKHLNDLGSILGIRR